MADIPTRPAIVGCSLLVTGVLACLGLLYELRVVGWARFSLDYEDTPASMWSALLLVAAAVAAARTARGRGGPARGSLAALFVSMAGDEAFGIHESLERVTGVDWQVLFAPIVGVAAVAFVVVLRGVPRPGARVTLVAAAAAWTVAQVFEKLEWHGGIKQPHYWAMMLCEGRHA